MAQATKRGRHRLNAAAKTASFIVGLTLTDADRDAAQPMSLNNAFEDLALFREFTEMEADNFTREGPSHLVG